MFALRCRYDREADEGAASSASLPQIPAKRPIRVRDNDEIDESSASLPENGIKSKTAADKTSRNLTIKTFCCPDRVFGKKGAEVDAAIFCMTMLKRHKGIYRESFYRQLIAPFKENHYAQKILLF